MSEPNHQAVALVERGEVAPQQHPLALLQQAIERGNVDTSALEKLMDLAERHDANEAKKAFDRAMVDLKKELPTVLDRDQKVDFTGQSGKRVYYTHTSLAYAVEQLIEPLTRFGFSHSWSASTENGQVNVTCRLTHVQGHCREMTIGAPPDKSGSKSPAQAVASTITLLERYSLLALLGIATADMKEPRGETPPDHVDTSRNMRALKACIDAGRTREEAEKHVGKPVDEWTAEDLDFVREWLEPEVVTRMRRAKTLEELQAAGAELSRSDVGEDMKEAARQVFLRRRAELGG